VYREVPNQGNPIFMLLVSNKPKSAAEPTNDLQWQHARHELLLFRGRYRLIINFETRLEDVFVKRVQAFPENNLDLLNLKQYEIVSEENQANEGDYFRLNIRETHRPPTQDYRYIAGGSTFNFVDYQPQETSLTAGSKEHSCAVRVTENTIFTPGFGWVVERGLDMQVTTLFELPTPALLTPRADNVYATGPMPSDSNRRQTAIGSQVNLLGRAAEFWFHLEYPSSPRARNPLLPSGGVLAHVNFPSDQNVRIGFDVHPIDEYLGHPNPINGQDLSYTFRERNEVQSFKVSHATGSTTYLRTCAPQPNNTWGTMASQLGAIFGQDGVTINLLPTDRGDLCVRGVIDSDWASGVYYLAYFPEMLINTRNDDPNEELTFTLTASTSPDNDVYADENEDGLVDESSP